jgi:hypothetical protein
LHAEPVGHVVPHLPQFALSVWRSVHPFPPELPPDVLFVEEAQYVSPEAHRLTHLPPEQSSVLWHGAPHAPQFAGSELRSVHAPLHSFCPGGHTQPPSAHVMVELHATPHPPQLLVLLATSTQSPLQYVRVGSLHDSVHMLAMHSAPCGHWCPHDPQFDGSLVVSVQPLAELFDELLEPHPSMPASATKGTSKADTSANRTRLLPGFHMAPGV